MEQDKAKASASAYDLGEITLDNVEDAFTYHMWDGEQAARGAAVRKALVEAVRTILLNVPRSPIRTRAINHLVDARMFSNAAITFDKKP